MPMKPQRSALLVFDLKQSTIFETERINSDIYIKQNSQN